MRTSRSLFAATALLFAASTSGCGGPCADYCSAGVDCAEQQSSTDACSGSDLDQFRSACTDACEAGIDAVPSAEQDDFNLCLDCLSSVLADKCELDSDALAGCTDECKTISASSFESFGKALEAKLESADLPSCVKQSGSSSSCNFSSSSTSGGVACSLDCGSFTASCSGASGQPISCSCSGNNSAATFDVASCEDLQATATGLCGG